jgi:hypothetical protein
MTIYRGEGRRIFNLISLVPRGGVTCTNFAERNFGRSPCISYGATKKDPTFRKFLKNPIE